MAILIGHFDYDGTDATKYSGEEFAQFVDLLTQGQSGVVNIYNDLAVTTTGGLISTIDKGASIIDGYYLIQDELTSGGTPYTLTHDAETGNDRIDRIILDLDKTADTFVIGIKKGTAAGSPTAPTLDADQLSLAQVYITDGSATITSVTDEREYITYGSDFEGIGKNLIINGNPMINQRVYVNSATLASGVYGRDRFKAGASGGDCAFVTVENLVTATIAAGKSLIQIVEGVNIQSGTHVLSWTGTAQCQIDGGGYDDSGMTATLTGGTDAVIEIGTGTFTNLKLEKGSVATEFVQNTYQDEEIRCLPYCYKLPSGKDYAPLSDGRCISTTKARITVYFSNYMRTNGDYTLVTNGDFVLVKANGSITSISSLTLTSSTSTRYSVELEAVASGLVKGRATVLFPDGDPDAYLILDDEL